MKLVSKVCTLKRSVLTIVLSAYFSRSFKSTRKQVFKKKVLSSCFKFSDKSFVFVVENQKILLPQISLLDDGAII